MTPNVLVAMPVLLWVKLLVRRVQFASSQYTPVLLWSNRDVEITRPAVSRCAPVSLPLKREPATVIDPVKTPPMPQRLVKNREPLMV